MPLKPHYNFIRSVIDLFMLSYKVAGEEKDVLSPVFT
jgi:hypothetical protein